MTGLDANVLLRFLVQDDPIQSPIATQFIRETCSEASPGYISLVALAETVWVLASTYKLRRPDIGDAVEVLLLADTLSVQDEYQVYSALQIFRSGAGDFADALILALNQRAGCSTSVTFDVKASRLEGFTRL